MDVRYSKHALLWAQLRRIQVDEQYIYRGNVSPAAVYAALLHIKPKRFIRKWWRGTLYITRVE